MTCCAPPATDPAFTLPVSDPASDAFLACPGFSDSAAYPAADGFLARPGFSVHAGTPPRTERGRNGDGDWDDSSFLALATASPYAPRAETEPYAARPRLSPLRSSPRPAPG